MFTYMYNSYNIPVMALIFSLLILLTVVTDEIMQLSTAAFLATRIAKKTAMEDTKLVSDIQQHIHRLNDPYTHVDASSSLKSIIVDLTPDQLPSFLSLLKKYGPQVKLNGSASPSSMNTPTGVGDKATTGGVASHGPPVVRGSIRKEFVSLYSLLAIHQSSQCALGIARVSTMLLPWLSDSEVAVREQAADVFGDIARVVFPLTSMAKDGCNMSVLIKPLLANLSSPKRETRAGAALGLARIFANGNSTQEKLLSQYLDRCTSGLNAKLRLMNRDSGAGATMWISVANLMVSTGQDFLPYVLSYIETLIDTVRLQHMSIYIIY